MKRIKSKRWALLKFAGILLFILLLTAAWEHHVTVSIRQSVSDRTIADEQQMWSVLCALSRAGGEYYRACGAVYKEGCKSSGKTDKTKQSQEDGANPDKANDIKIGVPPRNFAVAELRRNAAKYAGQLRRCRRQLEQIGDDPDIGYRQDALMYCALCERSFDLQQLAWEFLLNTEAAVAGHRVSSDKCSRIIDEHICYYCEPEFVGYYKLYYGQTEGRGFQYPFICFLMLEKDALRNALHQAEYYCCRGHGGYAAWHGSEREAIWTDDSDISELFFEDYSDRLYMPNYSGDYYERASFFYRSAAVAKASRAREEELRRKSHSLYAAGWLTWHRFAENMRVRWRVCREVYWDKPDEKTVRGLRKQRYDKLFRAPEDELWNLTRFLCLCTDNFLWKVKFSESCHVEDKKIYPDIIKAKYGKNSAEMRFYRNVMASDLKTCRKKMQEAQCRDFPELQEAAGRLCANAEAVLKAWDSYQAGKMNYSSLIKTLRKLDESYYHWRYAAIKSRWDYLLKVNKNAVYTAKKSISNDGIPCFLIDSWVSDVFEKRENA